MGSYGGLYCFAQGHSRELGLEAGNHVKITARSRPLFVTCWPEKAGQQQNLTVFLAVLFQDEKKESFIHAGFEGLFDTGPDHNKPA